MLEAPRLSLVCVFFKALWAGSEWDSEGPCSPARRQHESGLCPCDSVTPSQSFLPQLQVKSWKTDLGSFGMRQGSWSSG